ncbi:MAG: AAA family ATPase, partial [Cyanobacteriota bacterium]|nr:AAA family ATPase [Cyanobacteriota bacterium]
MLKRIYIDNFRCLVNFELEVDSINLFLGLNGSGKSSVFDVLRKIQAWTNGKGNINNTFSVSDCTQWQTSLIQSFELEIDSNGGRYKYELALEYEPQSAKFKIQNERLWFNGQPLLQFEQGEVQLYKDDDSEWSKYPFNSLQSVLS